MPVDIHANLASDTRWREVARLLESRLLARGLADWSVTIRRESAPDPTFGQAFGGYGLSRKLGQDRDDAELDLASRRATVLVPAGWAWGAVDPWDGETVLSETDLAGAWGNDIGIVAGVDYRDAP